MEETALPIDIPRLPDLTGQIFGTINDFVAAGGFGSVYQCDWRQPTLSPVKVAVKVIRCPTSEQDKVTLRRLQRETGIWAYLIHENIAPLYGTTKNFGPFPALVSLWFPHGTLHRLIADKGTSLSTRSKLNLLHDIACGLNYLHGFPIVHGDLTSCNILVDLKGGKYKACLTDFGLSTVLGGLLNDPAVEASSVRYGAVRWAAPELVRSPAAIKPTEQNDMYSFGRVMFHILTLRMPWNDLDNYQVLQKVLNGEEDKRPEMPHATPDLTDARWNKIELCWSIDTSTRPSASQAMTFLMSELLALTDDGVPVGKEQESHQSVSLRVGLGDSVRATESAPHRCSSQTDKHSHVPKSSQPSNVNLPDTQFMTRSAPIISTHAQQSRGTLVQISPMMENNCNDLVAGASSQRGESTLPFSGLIESVNGIGLLNSGNQPILKPKNDRVSSHPHNTRLFINLYPTQELGLVVTDSDAISHTLKKYMEGNNFDLPGIGELLSSPDTSLDPNLQCAALQLLEHAAECQSANFAQCMRKTLGPVAKLVADSPDIQVHQAALDTLKLFLAFPHIAESRMPDGVVDAVSDDLNSSDRLVQLASVKLLEAASRSEEILIGFSAAVSRIPSALPSMPFATQVTALKVMEVSAGSNAHELVEAVAATFHYLIEPLTSPEAVLQIAALKVLEVAAGTQDRQLAHAVKIILPVVNDILSSGKTDVHSAVSKVLEVVARNEQLTRRGEGTVTTKKSLCSSQTETEATGFHQKPKPHEMNERLSSTTLVIDLSPVVDNSDTNFDLRGKGGDQESRQSVSLGMGLGDAVGTAAPSPPRCSSRTAIEHKDTGSSYGHIPHEMDERTLSSSSAAPGMQPQVDRTTSSPIPQSFSQSTHSPPTPVRSPSQFNSFSTPVRSPNQLDTPSTHVRSQSQLNSFSKSPSQLHNHSTPVRLSSQLHSHSTPVRSPDQLHSLSTPVRSPRPLGSDSTLVQSPKQFNKYPNPVALHPSATDSSLSVSGPLNVLIFGETGVGKSSVINLIQGRELAQTSADAPTCTLEHTPYEVNLEDHQFKLWEVSSIAPMNFFRRLFMKWNLKRKYKKLFNGDGVYLLLYCMRSSRAQGTMIRDYKFFTNIIGSTKDRVPVAAVVTWLEDYPLDMDDWWKKNEDNLRENGMQFSKHACITALPDDPSASPILRSRQQRSQQIVRELICDSYQSGRASKSTIQVPTS